MVFGGGLYLSQAAWKFRAGPQTVIWFITSGAQEVGGHLVTNPLQAPIWGAGRTFSLEDGVFRFYMLDLDPR